MIKKTGSHSWTVLSKSGRRMGTYSTKAAAKKRLRQIEAFKHMKVRRKTR